jgi:hypothetical protein
MLVMHNCEGKSDDARAQPPQYSTNNNHIRKRRAVPVNHIAPKQRKVIRVINR